MANFVDRAVMAWKIHVPSCAHLVYLLRPFLHKIKYELYPLSNNSTSTLKSMNWVGSYTYGSSFFRGTRIKLSPKSLEEQQMAHRLYDCLIFRYTNSVENLQPDIDRDMKASLESSKAVFWDDFNAIQMESIDELLNFKHFGYIGGEPKLKTFKQYIASSPTVKKYWTKITTELKLVNVFAKKNNVQFIWV